MRRGKPWTEEEDAKLVELANKGIRDEDIAEELGRTTPSVTVRRSRHHGLIREGIGGTAWSQEEEDALRQGFNDKLTDSQMSDKLGRTTAAVRDRRHQLGLLTKKPGRRSWSDSEDKALAKHHKLGTPVKEVAKALNRTPGAVSTRKYMIGLIGVTDDYKVSNPRPIPKQVKRRIEQAKEEELKGNGVMRAKHDIDKKLKRNNEYKVINNGNNYMNHASPRRIMKYLYSTRDLVVFQCENYKETFRKLDIAIGNPTIKELN